MDFPGHFDQIFQQLNYQRLHGQLCDCVIVVGSRHFKAHRSVLAACSTHFRALFTAAEGEGSLNMIQLDSEVVTAEAFAALVEMMYTSTLTLGESNVMDVLLAASHLHLNAVVKACKHYLTTRTLPMSPPPPPQQSSPRVQRSFLLQQLGANEVALLQNGAASVEQRASFPIHRFHKRKMPPFTVVPEDRPRQRARPSDDPVSPLLIAPATEGNVELFSPDSLKVDEGSKSEDQKFDDLQLPSQSDSGLGPEGRCSKVEHKDEGTVVQGKEGGNKEEEEEHLHQVVVKSEPLSSPEPGDETSEVTSQAEGSGDKIELSPGSSDRSFSDPQSSTDRIVEGAGGSGGTTSFDGTGDGKQGFSVSSFLCPKGYRSGVSVAGDDNFPNTTTAETHLEGDPGGYVLNLEPVSGSPASSLLHQSTHQHFLSNDSHNDSLFLRPSQEGLSYQRVGPDPFTLDFQRSGLGLHPLPRSPGGGTTLGFPGYRRIAPKTVLNLTEESLSSDGATTSSGLLQNGTGFDNSVPTVVPPPQLTRASADVLSKCKKALSEHNVLVVEGARKYACKICCKTFLTLTDCKKHIRVHTGEKPYACLKCGKRFSQSSHLYKHSKTTCLRWQNNNLPTSLL